MLRENIACLCQLTWVSAQADKLIDQHSVKFGICRAVLPSMVHHMILSCCCFQASVETSWLARGSLAFRILAAIVIIYRLSGRPAATLPPDLLWPLNAYFAFPDWSLMGIGGITAFSWLSLCSRGTTAIAWALLGS